MVIAVVSCLLFRRLFTVKAKRHTRDIETIGVENNADDIKTTYIQIGHNVNDIDLINLVGINKRITSTTRVSTKKIVNKVFSKRKRKTKENPDHHEQRCYSCKQKIKNCRSITITNSSRHTIENSTCSNNVPRRNKRKVKQDHISRFRSEENDCISAPSIQKHAFDVTNANDENENIPLSRDRPCTAFDNVVNKEVTQTDMEDNYFPICENRNIDDYKLIGIKHADLDCLSNHDAGRKKIIDENDHHFRFANDVCDELSLPHIRTHKLVWNTPSSRPIPSTALNRVVEKVFTESEIDEKSSTLCNTQNLVNYKLIGINHLDIDSNDHVGHEDRQLHINGNDDHFFHFGSKSNDYPSHSHMQKQKVNVNTFSRTRPSTALNRVLNEVSGDTNQDEDSNESCHKQIRDNYNLIDVKNTNPNTYDHSNYVTIRTKSKREGTVCRFSNEIKDDLSAPYMPKHELDVMAPKREKRSVTLSRTRPSTALNKVVEKVLAQSDVDDHSFPINLDNYKLIGIKHADPDTYGRLSRDVRRIKDFSKYDHRCGFVNEVSEEPSSPHILNHTVVVNTPSSRTRPCTAINKVAEKVFTESKIDNNSSPFCNHKNLAKYKLSAINHLDLNTNDHISHVSRRLNRNDNDDHFFHSGSNSNNYPTRYHMQKQQVKVNTSSITRPSTALNRVVKEVLREKNQDKDPNEICYTKNHDNYKLIEVKYTNLNTYDNSNYVTMGTKSKGEDNVFGFPHEIKDELSAPCMQKNDFGAFTPKVKKGSLTLSRTRPSRTRPSTALQKVVENVLAQSDVDDKSFPICDNQNLDNYNLIGIKHADPDSYGHLSRDARPIKSISKYNHRCLSINEIRNDVFQPGKQKYELAVTNPNGEKRSQPLSRIRPSTALNKVVTKVLEDSDIENNSIHICDNQNIDNNELNGINHPDKNIYDHSSYVTRTMKIKREGNVLGFPHEINDVPSAPHDARRIKSIGEYDHRCRFPNEISNDLFQPGRLKHKLAVVNQNRERGSEPLSRIRPSTPFIK